MNELIQIDELLEKCGYSYNSETNINNGYNCKHPDQEEFEMVDNEKIGKCFAWSCPLAPKADLQDLKELDSNLFDEYKESADDQGCIESDWVVVCIDEIEVVK